MLSLLFVNMASASVDFDANNNTYTIDTIWPTWLWGDGESIVKLVDNTDQCLVDCSFTLEFQNEEEVNLLEDLNFVNEAGDDVSENIEEMQFLIGKYETITRTNPIFEEVCEDQFVFNNATGLNETQNICTTQQTGEENYTEEELIWNEYKGEAVSGLSYLKLNAKKKANRRADWIVTFRGEKLTAWAWWDTDWSYKREIGNLNGTMSLLYNLSYYSGMNNNFSDVRFLDYTTESEELNFTIMNKVDGDHAMIRFNNKNVSNAWMYYGNSLAGTSTESFDNLYWNAVIGYTFDNGNTNDDTSTGNNAVNTGATWTANGVLGGAYILDGTNDYITIPNLQNYLDKDTGTLSMWFYADDDHSVAEGFPFEHYSSNQDRLYFSYYNGYLTFAYMDGLINKGSIKHQVNYGEWVHVSGTWANKRLKLYVNGELVNQSTGDAVVVSFTSSNGYNIGHASQSNNRFFDGNVDDILIHTTNLSETQIKYLAETTQPNFTVGAEEQPYGSISVDFVTPPTPVNYANVSAGEITVRVNASYENSSLTNISYDFYLENGSVISEVYPNETYEINITLPDGHHHYNVTICGTETIGSTIVCGSTETRHLNHDTQNPILSNAENLTDLVTLTVPINSTWSYNVTDANLDSCYYNTSENSTYTIVTCNASIITEWQSGGNKTIQYCANDTLSNYDCNTDYIYIYYITYEQANEPESIAEGFDATFNLTLNMTSIPSTTASLIINNTVYAPDTTQSSTNGYYFEKTITIPDGWGNSTGILQDWYWNYSISGVVDASTTTDNITVYELAIDDCSSYSDVIFNFTLRDEETNEPINESAGANVEVDLTLTSKTNSNVYLTYSNTWMDENNPQICLPTNVLNNSQYWVDLTVGYSSTDHVWEFYYIDSGTLNATKTIELFNGHTTSNISLRDLLTTDSTSFLFNYFDQDGLAVNDAIVHVMRKYIGNGEFLEVERSKADENGDTIVHLVEEDVIYFFYITQYGQLLYTSSTYTALCQSTPCTIQIEASGESASFDTDWDLIDGGAYTVSSIAGSREVNLTFDLNDTSEMNLTIYKYNSDGSYLPVISDTVTASSGSVIVTVPQGAGNVSFFASVYQDDDFINSEWVDFEEKAQDRLGITLSLLIAGLIILSLGLIAVSEGAGTIIFIILGVALSGFLGIMTIQLSTGVNVVVYLVVAGGILLWKLTGGRR